jgi:hypothetical protein
MRGKPLFTLLKAKFCRALTEISPLKLTPDNIHKQKMKKESGVSSSEIVDFRRSSLSDEGIPRPSKRRAISGWRSCQSPDGEPIGASSAATESRKTFDVKKSTPSEKNTGFLWHKIFR